MLTAQFPKVEVSGTPAGLHTLVKLPFSGDDERIRIQSALHNRGVRVYSLRRYCHDGVLPAQYREGLWLVLGFGGIPIRRITKGVQVIAQTLGADHGPIR